MGYRCMFESDIYDRCTNYFNLKAFEFKHPDFQEKNIEGYLCEYHFNEVFGEILEEDKKLLRKLMNEEAHYKKLKAEVKQSIKNGMGNEYFDWNAWNATAYTKVEKAKDALYNFRRNTCRYELCDQKIKNIRKPFLIRIYPYDPTIYMNLFFCGEVHWEKKKYLIGILKTKKVDNRYKPTTLDNFPVDVKSS